MATIELFSIFTETISGIFGSQIIAAFFVITFLVGLIISRGGFKIIFALLMSSLTFV